MANKRIIELNERTVINMGDYLMVDDATGSRKLAMSTLFNYLTYSSLMFVDTLPTTDIDPTVIYLVPHSGSTTQWDEYIYRDNQWILIGTSTLDLTSIYQSKTDNNLQTTSKQIVGAINEVKSALTDVTDGVATPSTTGASCEYSIKNGVVYGRYEGPISALGAYGVVASDLPKSKNRVIISEVNSFYIGAGGTTISAPSAGSAGIAWAMIGFTYLMA